MSDKKDVFGVGLLDLLSNALIASIVLMLLVGAFLGKLGIEKELEELYDDGGGQIETIQKFKPQEPIPDSGIVIVSVSIFSKPYKYDTYHLQAFTSRTFQDKCLEVKQGLFQKNHWQVIKECITGDTWQVKLFCAGTECPDSVSFFITRGTRAIWDNTLTGDEIKRKNGILFEIIEANNNISYR